MESNNRLFSFSIDEMAARYFSETGRWARFLSIIGFVFIALLALGGIFGATVLGSMGSMGMGGAFSAGAGVAMALMYLLIAALYLYPTIALYRFGKLIRPALNTQDQRLFNEAIRNLRNVFKFMGVLTLIVVGLYALIFIVGILGATLGSL